MEIVFFLPELFSAVVFSSVFFPTGWLFPDTPIRMLLRIKGPTAFEPRFITISKTDDFSRNISL